jgi:hypothetical protein
MYLKPLMEIKIQRIDAFVQIAHRFNKLKRYFRFVLVMKMLDKYEVKCYNLV